MRKAPSSWRRDGSEEPAPRNGSQTRYQVDNPHQPRSDKKKSRELNPKVYPDWWGEETSSPNLGDRFHRPKRLRSADPCKAKINRAIKRHCEDSLDKRLRKVYESEFNEPQIIENVHLRQPSSHCYAYTRQSLVSPVRHALPGQSNIPMTYTGPPCQAELQRN